MHADIQLVESSSEIVTYWISPLASSGHGYSVLNALSATGAVQVLLLRSDPAEPPSGGAFWWPQQLFWRWKMIHQMSQIALRTDVFIDNELVT